MTMSLTPEQLDALMQELEHERLEFKEAKNSYDFEKLVEYCVALANEGGGHIILGVTDRAPRTVVGTSVFDPIERTKAGLVDRLHFRVEVQVMRHPNGRVLIFHVPPRPVGTAIQYKGKYLMRASESLVPMTPDMLRRIFDEVHVDFSAQSCPEYLLGRS